MRPSTFLSLESGALSPTFSPVVVESGKASTSLLQRRLRIGYARAARIIEEMEEQGVIGAADGSRPREVLISSLDDVFGSSEDDKA